MKPFAIVLALAFTLALSAQQPVDKPDKPVEKHTTAEAVLVVEFDGPALLRSRFRTTNLGSMLAVKEAGDLWTAVMEPVRQVAASLGDEVPARLDSLLSALANHRGRVRIVVDLTPRAGERSTPIISAVIVVEPDGRTDLGAIAKLASAALELARVPKIEIEAGQRQLRVAMFGPKRGLVLPNVVDGRLVIAVSEDIVEYVGRGYPASSASTRLSAELQKSALAMRVDAPRVVAVLTEHMIGWPFEEKREFLRVFGVDSLRDITFTVSTAGPRVVGEVSVGFQAGERGMFAALFPAVAKVSGVDQLAPTGEDWQSGHFDWAQLFRCSCELGRTHNDFDLEASANEEVGIRLLEDLLVHMDTGYLELGSLMGRVRDEEADVSRGGEPEVCFAFKLKDTKAFAKGWETLTKKYHFWDTDPELVEGVEVHNVDFLGIGSMPLRWAIVADLLVFYYGDDEGVTWVEDLVRRSLAPPEEPGRVLSAEWQRLLRYAPPGHNGSGELDVTGLFRDVRWELLEEFAGPEVGGIAKSVLRELLPLMRRFDVARGVTMSGHDGDRWRYRVLW